MQFKLTNIQTSQAVGQDESVKTHALQFTEVDDSSAPQGLVTPLLSGPSTVTLRLTAAAAANYTLGSVYSLTLTTE